MTRRFIPLLVLLGGCAPATVQSPVAPPARASGDVGVLVMAHGGSDSWNQTVADAVAPLRARAPTAVAYGMADPRTLSAGLDSLRERGVRRVAVVRLFISGESFLIQTNYLLGLSRTAPERFVLVGHDAEVEPPAPIDHGLLIATHEDGLMTSDEARTILVDRALGLSRDSPVESVLLIAHGMGDETKNDRVLQSMEAIAARLREAGFAAVAVATLREDWEDKRSAAEAGIREFVASETAAGRRVIVVPMRLSGFGPYAEVLAGLDFTPGEGLLPHAQVTAWILSTATRVACDARWPSPFGSCGSSAAWSLGAAIER